MYMRYDCQMYPVYSSQGNKYTKASLVNFLKIPYITKCIVQWSCTYFPMQYKGNSYNLWDYIVKFFLALQEDIVTLKEVVIQFVHAHTDTNPAKTCYCINRCHVAVKQER